VKLQTLTSVRSTRRVSMVERVPTHRAATAAHALLAGLATTAPQVGVLCLAVKPSIVLY
jgi:hypothetical protein